MVNYVFKKKKINVKLSVWDLV